MLDPASLGDSFARLPYLFLRYRAQELNAAPSWPSFDPLVPADRSGDESRFFRACEERLRDKSLPPLPNAVVDVEPPYRL